MLRQPLDLTAEARSSLPQREWFKSIFMAALFQNLPISRGVDRCSGTAKLKETQAYPEGFGEGLAEVWLENEQRVVGNHKQYLKKLDEQEAIISHPRKRCRELYKLSVARAIYMYMCICTCVYGHV